MGNRPDYDLGTSGVQPLQQGDITRIGQACGNGWRKVFNVYAKLLYSLPAEFGFRQNSHSWQQYRDQYLLQKGSQTALMFSPTELSQSHCLHLLMGRTFARSVLCEEEVTWLNREFALDSRRCRIICPYFDYRQLSNQKILFLGDLIQELMKRHRLLLED